MRGDLHTHSLYSDGTFTPRELVDMALKSDFGALSITDHDTVCAFDEVLSYARSNGIQLIPGVEISSEHFGESVHVLGYAFDRKTTSLDEFCAVHRKRREERNAIILEKLKKQGMEVTMEEVISLSPDAVTFGRPHIARVLVEKSYVGDIVEAFKRYLGEGKLCYESGKRWTAEQAIRAIHEAGGKAVIAHPHLIRKGSLVRDLLTLDFDGIEAYYAMMSPAENRRWVEIAHQHNLFITGGSDFHGSVRPKAVFGSSWAPEETVDLLYTHFCSHV